MKLGLCNCCGAKIARKTSNGVLRYLGNMRQIHLVFRLGDRETRLHIPVCKDCSGNPDYEKIKLMLNREPTLVKLLAQGAIFESFGVDPVLAGQRIVDDQEEMTP